MEKDFMSQLFLGGGGGANDSVELDQLFFKSIPREKPILYIPLAMERKEDNYASCLNWFKSVFNPLGLTNIEMATDLTNKKYSDLTHFSAVYMGGGNTFKLLHELRETGFDVALARYYKSDGIIYGGSAGAMILGKDIMTAAHMDENEVQLKDTFGFNWVNNYSIWCHYTSEQDSNIVEYIKKHNENVIAIPENAGLLVENKKIKTIGGGRIFVFENNEKKVFEPNNFL